MAGIDSIDTGFISARDSGSGTGIQSVTTGFEPDLLLLTATNTNTSADTGAEQSVTDDYGWCHGVADLRDGSQFAIFAGTGSSSTNGQATEVDSSRVLNVLELANDGNTIGNRIQATASATTDGFDLDYTSVGNAEQIQYRAYRFSGDADFEVGVTTARTATGTQSVNTSVSPDFVKLWGQPRATTGTETIQDGNDWGWSHGWLTPNSQYAMAFTSYSNNVDDHVYGARNDDCLLVKHADSKGGATGTTEASGTLTSGGFDLDYTSVDGTGELFMYLAVEGNDFSVATVNAPTSSTTVTASGDFRQPHFVGNATIESMNVDGFVDASGTDVTYGWSHGVGGEATSSQSVLSIGASANSINAHRHYAASGEAVRILHTDRGGNNDGSEDASWSSLNTTSLDLNFTAATDTSQGGLKDSHTTNPVVVWGVEKGVDAPNRSVGDASLWTNKRTIFGADSSIKLTTDTTVPDGASAEVTLYEDVGVDGTGANIDSQSNYYDNADTAVLSGGSETNTLSGFDGGESASQYWAEIVLIGDSASVKSSPASVNSVSIGESKLTIVGDGSLTGSSDIVVTGTVIHGEAAAAGGESNVNSSATEVSVASAPVAGATELLAEPSTATLATASATGQSDVVGTGTRAVSEQLLASGTSAVSSSASTVRVDNASVVGSSNAQLAATIIANTSVATGGSAELLANSSGTTLAIASVTGQSDAVADGTKAVSEQLLASGTSAVSSFASTVRIDNASVAGSSDSQATATRIANTSVAVTGVAELLAEPSGSTLAIASVTGQSDAVADGTKAVSEQLLASGTSDTITAGTGVVSDSTLIAGSSNAQPTATTTANTSVVVAGVAEVVPNTSVVITGSDAGASTVWTDKQTQVGDKQIIELVTDTSIPASSSATVTLYEDVGGYGSGPNTDELGNNYDNKASATLSGGTEQNTLSGFDGNSNLNAYWAQIELDTNETSVTSTPSQVTSIEVDASKLTIVGDASLIGSSDIVANGTVTYRERATAGGKSDVNSSATEVSVASAPVAGNAEVVADSLATTSATISATGQSDVIGTGARTVFEQLLASGASDVTTAGTGVVRDSTSIAGTSDTITAGTGVVRDSTSIAGTSAVSSSSSKVRIDNASVAGSSDSQPTATRIANTSVAVTGVGEVVPNTSLVITGSDAGASTVWTDKQTQVGKKQTIEVVTDTSIATSSSATLTLYEDVGAYGSGTNTDELGNNYDNKASTVLSGGTERNILSGFDGNSNLNDYWARIELDTNDTSITLAPSQVTSVRTDASQLTIDGSGSLVGSSDIVASGAVTYRERATASGESDVTSSTTKVSVASAPVAGSAEVVADSLAATLATVSATGQSDVVGTGTRAVFEQLLASGASDVTTAGTGVVSDSTSIAGTSTVSPSSSQIKFNNASLAGSSDLLSTAFSGVLAALSVAGQADVQNLGTAVSVDQVDAEGSAKVFASALSSVAANVSALGSGNTAVSSSQIKTSTPAIVGSSNVSPVGYSEVLASLAAAGKSDINGTTTVVATGTTTVAGEASVFISAVPIELASVSLSGFADVSSDPAQTRTAEPSTTGTANLASTGSQTNTLSSSVVGFGGQQTRSTTVGFYSQSFSGASSGFTGRTIVQATDLAELTGTADTAADETYVHALSTNNALAGSSLLVGSESIVPRKFNALTVYNIDGVFVDSYQTIDGVFVDSYQVDGLIRNDNDD